MSTIDVNSVIVEKRLVVGNNSIGYSRKKILIPNVPTQGADSVSSVTVTNTGSGYTGIPTVSFSGGSGTGAAGSALMEALTATPVTAQAGAGSYAPSNTITLAGGTGTAPVLTVSTTKVVSATIVNGGSGATDGPNRTVNGTTGVGAVFQASVTISGGAITAINSITQAGNYTVNPTDINAEPLGGDAGAGATFALKMGVLTATVSTPGSLSAVAANPVAQGSTSGSGTGATFNLTYGVDAVTVTNGGQDYLSAPTVAFSGGAGTGAAATANISGTNDPVTVSIGFTQALSTDEYTVNVMPSQACATSVSNKAVDGFDYTLTPLDGGSLSASATDVVIEFTS